MFNTICSVTATFVISMAQFCRHLLKLYCDW